MALSMEKLAIFILKLLRDLGVYMQVQKQAF